MIREQRPECFHVVSPARFPAVSLFSLADLAGIEQATSANVHMGMVQMWLL